ncbi:MAG TPA: glycosyltransferase family 4 protein [Candidatus Agathobaculum merdipullorum]|nr:glycosyltransferase family 4 protein [Candidatus Agathobaculum merdipullorum]
MGANRKILYVASSFGHLASFHRPYLRWFAQQGCEVHAAAGGEPCALEGVSRFIPLPLEKRMASPRNFFAAHQLRALLRREDYALVSLHTSLAAFFTRLALRPAWKGRPVVMNTVHGYLFDDATPLLKRQLLLSAERLTAPVTDWLLTMNRQDDDIAQHYALGKAIRFTHGMGIDTTLFTPPDETRKAQLRAQLGLDPSALILVYAAEFSGRKSQSTLIQAMPRLPENTVLVLPGRGDRLEECKALAATLGVAARVCFPGFVQNMKDYYQAADLCVSSSRSEGLPFNIMEAMACGLPVIASNVKGHQDLVQPRVTGLLYPFGDADAFSGAVHQLDNPQRRRQMGLAARQAILPFDIHPVFEELTTLYRQAAGLDA